MNKRRNHRFEDSVTADLHEAEKCGGLQDELGQTLKRNWALGLRDETTRRLIYREIQPLLRKLRSGALPPFEANRLLNGPIRLGRDLFGVMVCLMLQMLAAGCLFLGGTGAGKTTIIMLLLVQLMFRGINILATESYKHDLRQAYLWARRLNHKFAILQPGQLRINPLQCHGRNPHLQLADSVDLLARTLRSDSPRSRGILTQGLGELYRSYGVFDDPNGVAPPLARLYLWIQSKPGLNTAARDALLDRMRAMLPSLGLSVACLRGWNPSDLADHSNLIETHGLGGAVDELILHSTIFTLFRQKIESGLVNGPLKGVILVDDALRTCISGQSNSGDLGLLEEFATVARGSGQGLIISLQSLHGVPPVLVRTLSNKFLGRCGGRADNEQMGADMGMDQAQRDWCALNLQPPLWVGQTCEGPSRKPFVFRVPKLPFLGPVSDAEATASLRCLDHLPVEFDESLLRWHPDACIEVESPESKEASAVALSPVESKLVRLVVRHGSLKSSDCARLCGISGKRFTAIRNRLMNLGYVRTHSVASNGRGRPSIQIEPTDLARGLVTQQSEDSI